MNIISSSSQRVRPDAAIQGSDLLSLLKASGSVEARVISLFDGKLLLSSRIGEILTSNTLGFKRGDLLLLRLLVKDGQPVLRVSRPPARSIVFDSSGYSRLNRLLAPDKPVLARVIGVSEAGLQVKLGQVNISIPVRSGYKPGQLITLVQDARRQSVEIQTLDTKAIYKALVAQMISRQPVNDPQTSLVSVLRILKNLSTEAKPTQPATTTKQPALISRPPLQTPPQPLVKPSTYDQLVKIPDGHQAEAKLVTQKSDIKQAGSERSVPLPRATTSPTVQKQASTNTSANKAPHYNSQFPYLPVKQSGGKFTAITPAYNTPVKEARTSAHTPVQPLKTGLAATPLKLPRTGSTNPAAAQQNPSTTSLGTRLQSPVDNTQPLEPGPVRQSFVTLRQLLQSLPMLSAVSATTIKQWFEFSGLIRHQDSAAKIDKGANPYKIFQQLAGKEAFIRELLQPQSTADKPPPDRAAVKEPMQDTPLVQIREALKLLEQALGQNLLQRAMLGLQQETQQPISLTLELPFMDETLLKPLQIELGQRNQAQDEEDKSWDVRISFELAGLGSIACHIILQGTSVCASFYSAEAHTRDSIEQTVPELRQQLAAAGFLCGEIHSFLGKLSRPAHGETIRVMESLLDIKV